VAIFFCDCSKVVLVVPHGPAEVVFFEHGSHVSQPLGSRVGVGVGAVNAELADVDGGVVKLRPALGEGEGDVDALGIPAGEAVLLDEELPGECGLLI